MKIIMEILKKPHKNLNVNVYYYSENKSKYLMRNLSKLSVT